MSRRFWDKKRKKKLPRPDIFQEINEIEKIMDEFMNQTFRSFRDRYQSSNAIKVFKPYVYRFSILLDSNGTPKVREFADARTSRQNFNIRDQEETLIDVLDGEEEVAVLAKLPGVEKENISIYTSKEGLAITADTPQGKYYKKLRLPKEVNSKTAKAAYKNGVLQVRFKKKRDLVRLHCKNLISPKNLNIQTFLKYIRHENNSVSSTDFYLINRMIDND